MIIKIRNITAYILLFLGITLGLKTIPSVIHKILNFFNIKNTIGMDLTNCQTIGYTITVNHFFYALFLFALLSLLVGLLLLFREQKLTFKYNYFNIGGFIIFLILIFQSIILLGYIFLLMLEDKLFDKHIIYNIAFAISLFTNLLFLVLYSLIWFDKTASNKAKLIVILILCCFSTHISMEMNSFIYFYGIGDIKTGFNPNTFFDGFEYVLNKLGIGVFCIEDSINPLILFFIFLSSFIVLYLILTYQIKQQAKKELKHETKEQLEKELKIIQDEIFIYEQQLALVKKERKTPFLSRDSKIEYITKENFLVSQLGPLKEHLTYIKYKLNLLEKKSS